MGQYFDFPTSPHAFTNAYGKRSLSYKLVKYLDDIQSAFENKIRVIDSMTYASDATAAAAWVASDTGATTGIVVTRNATQYVEGTSAVKFSTGSATFAADVTVTKTLTADPSTYTTDSAYAQDWSPYNFIGGIAYYHDTAGLAGTDIDVYIYDRHGNYCYADFPAIDTNHDQVYLTWELEFADFTGYSTVDWTEIKYVKLMFDDGMDVNEDITLDQILVYRFGNGKGPVVGNMVVIAAGEDSITRGMQIKHSPVGLWPVGISANDGDTGIIGIACNDADTGDDLLVQVTGLAIVELGSLTSLEVGDGIGCADDSAATVTEAASTMADAWAGVVGPVHSGDSLAQYGYAWVRIGNVSATPS